MGRSQAETVRRQTVNAAVDSSADVSGASDASVPLTPPSTATPAGEHRPSQRLRNQFNFNERAVQTASYPPRDRGTSSEPPPTATASGLQCPLGLRVQALV